MLTGEDDTVKEYLDLMQASAQVVDSFLRYKL